MREVAPATKASVLPASYHVGPMASARDTGTIGWSLHDTQSKPAGSGRGEDRFAAHLALPGPDARRDLLDAGKARAETRGGRHRDELARRHRRSQGARRDPAAQGTPAAREGGPARPGRTGEPGSA